MMRIHEPEPLEGELIEAEKLLPEVTDLDISRLRVVLTHCEVMERKFGREIGPILMTRNRSLYHEFRERLFVSTRQARQLMKRLEEQAQERQRR